MTAKRTSLWFGYLEAGAKGAHVVRDHSISTGSSSTIYLFNLEKGRILEYRREIAEPKLRELTDEEADRKKRMRAEYEKARKVFSPRVTVHPPRRKPQPEPEPEPEIPDFDADDEFPPSDDEPGEDEDKADED